MLKHPINNNTPLILFILCYTNKITVNKQEEYRGWLRLNHAQGERNTVILK